MHDLSSKEQLQNEMASLDKYRIIKELGRGAQAITYLVECSDTSLAAMKVYSLPTHSEWEAFKYFEREARALQGIEHPNVPAFLDSFVRLDEQPPKAYLVESYVDAQSLASHMQSGRRFSCDELYDIALQLCDILSDLHQSKPSVIHRDLKPSNILLDDAGKLYLIDFGVAASNINDDGSSVSGTFGYMPPE